MYAKRLASLREVLQEHKYDALFITKDTNRRYLSGFQGSTGTLLVTQHAALMLTDFRYRLQLEKEAPLFTLREVSNEVPVLKLLANLIVELGLRQIAFEADHLTVAQHQKLSALLGESGLDAACLIPAEGLVEKLRAVKDVTEIAKLRRAIALTDAAIEAVMRDLHPSQTESQVAWMLEVAMRERGAERLAFPVIVAAGPRSAMPHARPSAEPLGEGRPIVIDMGGVFEGYHADLTRTIILGEPDARFWQVYGLVLAAQQKAIAGIRPGMQGQAADALARDYLTAHGFGEEFGHGLGHNVGLEIHEGPSLARTKEDVLQIGNVFSVEPGLYFADWGGVRLEDLVLLQAQGCEVLSQTAKLKPPQ